MRFFLFMITTFVVSAYNILIYPGSQVPLYKYDGIKNSINNRLKNSTINFKNYLSFVRNNKNNTIIIGHSFGGYFGLLEAQNNNNTVKGIILLNSHFNSRGKMPYPRIDMKKISQPVLTILSKNDTRLPFKKAIDDLFYRDYNYLINKYFIINNNFNHFSGLDDNDTETEIISNQICNFIENIDNYSINSTEYSWYNKPLKFNNTRDVSFSLNILDAIFQICDFPLWQYYHYLHFLTLKPNHDINYQYSDYDSTLLKTFNTSIDDIKNQLNYEFNEKYNITWNITVLPTLHPSILYWLFKNPFLKNTSCGEIIVLPVNKNITYYKVPNRIMLLNN